MRKIKRLEVRSSLNFFVLMIMFSLLMTGCSNVTADEIPFDKSKIAFSLQDLTSKKLIVIDPGHGGTDLGSIFLKDGHEINEKDLNLKVSLLLCKMLKESEVDVRMTRYEDQEISLEERMKFANDLGAFLFLSIHFENGPNATNTVRVQYNTLIDEKTAQLMSDKLKENLKLDNFRTSEMEEVFKFSSMEIPCVLVDIPFHNSQMKMLDIKNYTSEEYSLEIAKALYDGTISMLDRD